MNIRDGVAGISGGALRQARRTPPHGQEPVDEVPHASSLQHRHMALLHPLGSRPETEIQVVQAHP